MWMSMRARRSTARRLRGTSLGQRRRIASNDGLSRTRARRRGRCRRRGARTHVGRRRRGERGVQLVERRPVGRGVHVMTGTLGSHAPSRIDRPPRSGSSGWPPASSGPGAAAAHRCRRASTARRGRRGARRTRCLANRTGRSPHRHVPGSIRPLVTSGGPSAVVGHRADEPVVLVAEVDARTSAMSPSVGPAVAGADRRRRRAARRATGPRPPPSRGPAAHEVRAARASDRAVAGRRQRLRGEHERARRARPRRTSASSTTTRAAQRSRSRQLVADRRGVACELRIDCGSTSADPCRPCASTTRAASARNSAAASAYGPPPKRDRPPRVVAATSG